MKRRTVSTFNRNYYKNTAAQLTKFQQVFKKWMVAPPPAGATTKATPKKHVNKYSKASRSGTDITCPHCTATNTVYNFSWTDLVCQHCKHMIPKLDWLNPQHRDKYDISDPRDQSTARRQHRRSRERSLAQRQLDNARDMHPLDNPYTRNLQQADDE